VVRICEYARGAGRTTLGVGGSTGKRNNVNQVISTNTPDAAILKARSSGEG